MSTSRVLVIGGTGYVGKHIVLASARLGHPTFLLVRESTITSKSQLIDTFKASGVNLIYGDIFDHEGLVKAVKQVDVVICAIGSLLISEQTRIIAAIKEAGNIKRFLPSEFGNDVDHLHAVGPAKFSFEAKAKIRRAIEAAGIPYTFVSNNFIAGFFLPNLAQAVQHGLPTNMVTILGDGNIKAVFVDEDDVGTYTIKAIDDPRTLNKILYVRPSSNTLSINELVDLYEKKTGKKLERTYVPEPKILKQIEESPMPWNFLLGVCHTAFVQGMHTNFTIKPSFGVEATQLYPDVKYTTVEEYLDKLL